MAGEIELRARESILSAGNYKGNNLLGLLGLRVWQVVGTKECLVGEYNYCTDWLLAVGVILLMPPIFVNCIYLAHILLKFVYFFDRDDYCLVFASPDLPQ